MASNRRRALLACLPLAFSACVWPAGDNRLFVTSEPAGAEVFVDDEPTGKTTPAILDLGGAFAGDHRIRLEKRGFEPETRTVTHVTRFDTSKWNDGAELTTWPSPLFWTVGDFVFPFEMRWSYVPHELYVTLFPEGTFLPKPGRTLEGERK